MSEHLPFANGSPCANSGRNWLLRVGLFQLNCPKQRADDWVWIMDHTLQLGPYKCLVIVGLRLSRWDRRRPLGHEDMTLLNLTPMKSSSGERVEAELQKLALSIGQPRAVVSDEGTDLKRAMELFQREFPETRHQFDLKHKCAGLLKRELDSDPRWAAFVKATNTTKLSTTQTDLAYLTPPGLKAKARYMNLEPLVRWGTNALRFLDENVPGRRSQSGPSESAGLPRSASTSTVSATDRERILAKLGWLREYQTALAEWSELIQVVKAAEKRIHGGVHNGLVEELRSSLEPLATRPDATQSGAKRMVENLGSFLSEQSKGLKDDERVIGSSEVLESIFGRYKRLQSQHSKGGMTAMLLSIGAMCGTLTHSTIAAGLEQVRMPDVDHWCQDHLGSTIQAQRTQAFRATKTE